MKIIFDNIAFALQKAGGVSAVWTELLKRIPQDFVEKYLEYDKMDNIFREELSLPADKIIKCRIPLGPKIHKLFDLTCKKKDKFIFHSSTYRICKSKKAINIITVHDFIDEKFPTKNFLLHFIRTQSKKNRIKNADALICVSENTKKDLLHYYSGKLDTNKIHIVHNGKSEDFKIDNSNLNEFFSELKPQNYVMFVGNRYGYKNFTALAEAMRKFCNKELVLVGGRNLTPNEQQMIKINLKTRKYYHYQHLPNKDLNILYNNAFCLVYPSAYEGFGIPVIEAQSAGCPVIASNSSSLPEILGESAMLLKDTTPHSICEALCKLEEDDFRDNLISKGLENSKKYSWDIMTQKYLEIYNHLWNNK
jgi:mannosyltransferase